MSTQAACKALAESAGVGFDYEAGTPQHFPFVELVAPRGKVFATSGCHIDCSIQGEYGKRTLPWGRTLAEVRAIIEAGLQDCPDGDACDVCADA